MDDRDFADVLPRWLVPACAATFAVFVGIVLVAFWVATLVTVFAGYLFAFRALSVPDEGGILFAIFSTGASAFVGSILAVGVAVPRARKWVEQQEETDRD